jgi:ketosteroid isomerase-like protein
MKKLSQFPLLYLLIALNFFTSCTPKEDPQVEIRKVETILQSYFDGISNFDYQKMRDACSSDYVLFEDGTIWTVEDHISYLKSLEGKARISYNFKDVNKNVEGSVAWITHRNIAEAAFEGNEMHFEWIESAVFKKIDGNWKMVLLHSTTAKPSEKQ